MSVAEYIVNGLDLEMPEKLNQYIETGLNTTCAITGERITEGVPWRRVIPSSTGEYLDLMHGMAFQYLSLAAATAFKGSWMERRLPTPTLVCNTFETRCIGNLEWVQKLCDYFTHIGKLRLGRVFSVLVEPADYDEQDILRDGDALIKPVPAQADLIPWLENPSLIGWTPPFWKPSLFATGWRAGMRVDRLLEPDFFADVPSGKI